MTAPDATNLSNAAAFRLIALTLVAAVGLLVALVMIFGAPGLGIFGLLLTVVFFVIMLAFTAGN